MGTSCVVGTRREGMRPRTDGRRRAVVLRRSPAALRPAFTLAELMVSVAVLLILMMMVGWIFSTATRSSTAAMANNETMGNARAADDQFSRDFRGMLKDRFIGIWYQLTPDPRYPGATPPRYLRTDRIVFFTSGDHSTIRQLDAQTPPRPIRSSVARVFYGHEAHALAKSDVAQWIVARRAKLLASQNPLSLLPTPPPNRMVLPSPPNDGIDPSSSGDPWDAGKTPPGNDLYDNWEYETIMDSSGAFCTLNDWHNASLFPIESFFLFAPSQNPPYLGLMVQNTTTALWSWIRRPAIRNSDDPAGRQGGMQMLFLPGCAEFKVQRWIERDPITGMPLAPGMSRWYPEEDPDGDGWANQIHATNTSNGDFVTLSAATGDATNVREYFNGPHPRTSTTVVPARQIPGGSTWYFPGMDGWWLYYPEQDVPKAIKITIRLFDANKRIADGQLITMTFGLEP
jgi:prepilin-type N-terminal cleavage/methylation domain-containing protein